MAMILLVALGGAIGGAGRHWLSGVVAHRVGVRFPWGTLAVNASGAFLIGLLAGAFGSPGAAAASSPAWAFFGIGVLGSYTTVSSFSLQTLALLRAGEVPRAAWNVTLSFSLCLGGAALGYATGASLFAG